MPCMARRTHWVNTRFRIDNGFTVSHIVLCDKEASGDLCKKCANRRRDNTRDQSAMLHGLLTEPIPENSFIYGGPVFWAKMKKFEDAGKVLSEDARAWLAMASAAQDAAEAIGGCKVQRVLVNDTQRMVKVKEKAKEKDKDKDKEKKERRPERRGDQGGGGDERQKKQRRTERRGEAGSDEADEAEEEEACTWVQCERCAKWRRIELPSGLDEAAALEVPSTAPSGSASTRTDAAACKCPPRRPPSAHHGAPSSPSFPSLHRCSPSIGSVN